MADKTESGISILAFVVGGLVVAIGVVAYFMYDDRPGSGNGNTDIKLEVTTPQPAPTEPAPAEPAPVEPAPEPAPGN